jgi:PadR family transcriptional regulator, regulatory protein AphA
MITPRLSVHIGMVGLVPETGKKRVPRRKLNATSYVVLGLLSYAPATSYDLKQFVARTVGNFWAFAHSQLYDEPARLVADGLIAETVEESGRRKRTYEILPAGREALRLWLADRTLGPVEVRDLGLLKLFFAGFGTPADILRLAEDRRDSHRQRADDYTAQRAELTGYADRWQLNTIELGIRYERCVERFWADLLAELREEQQP